MSLLFLNDNESNVVCQFAICLTNNIVYGIPFDIVYALLLETFYSIITLNF